MITLVCVKSANSQITFLTISYISYINFDFQFARSLSCITLCFFYLHKISRFFLFVYFLDIIFVFKQETLYNFLIFIKLYLSLF